MDQIDAKSALYFQGIRTELQTGIWNTGQIGGKGFVVSEPINALEESGKDSIKRYTDKYLPHQQIGHTIKDFDFQRHFLPPELYTATGLVKTTSSNGNGNGASFQCGSFDVTQSRLETVERRLEQQGSELEKDENDENNDEDAEELEDEFEELEDDDYNAEKYFDDGEDYGDGEDDGNEAAY